MQDSPERKVIIAYQVIAILADSLGLYWHPDVQHALQYLEGERDDDPLPFPSTQPLIGGLPN